MEEELRQFFKSVGRDRLKGIWQRVKAGRTEDLEGEERLYASVMEEHREKYFHEFEAADARLLDPDTDTDAFLHISLHVIIENQLNEKAPVEAVQLYNALKKKKVSRHDAIHLLAAVFVPFLFDVLKTGSEFDREGYRELLRRAKNRKPEKIWKMLDQDVYPDDEDADDAALDPVYRLRIELEDIEPPIWRSILIPASATFRDLHAAVQAAMGWEDAHLHRFEVREPLSGKRKFIGRPLEDEGWEDNVAPGRLYCVGDFIGPGFPECRYVYDYGDNWRHRILLEELLPFEADRNYPVCLDGARACPPEDVGGPPGYDDLLRILADPEGERYPEVRERIGDFDPEKFDPKEVEFFPPE